MMLATLLMASVVSVAPMTPMPRVSRVASAGTAAPTSLAAAPLLHDEKASLNITFHSPDSKPIPQALISLAWDGENGEVAQYVDRAGHGGTIEIPVPAGVKIRWTARAPNHGQAKSGVVTMSEAGEDEQLRIVLHSGVDAIYTAIFVDSESKEPITGVLVDRVVGERQLSAQHVVRRPQKPLATSGKDGRAAIHAASWRSTHLLAYADGYAYAHIAAGGRRDAPGLLAPEVIELEREVAIQVTLLEGTDELWVRATGEMSTRGGSKMNDGPVPYGFGQFHSEPADGDGVLLIRGLQAETQWSLEIMKGKHVYRRLSPITSGAAGSVMRQTYDCWERGIVSGTLRVADGDSAEGRSLSLTPLGGRAGPGTIRDGKPIATAKTGEQGKFRFTEVPIGSYYVSIADSLRPGALADQVSQPIKASITSEAHRAEANLTEVTGGYLSGTVLNATGKPAAAWLHAAGGSSRFQAHTDADGLFRIGPFHPETEVSLSARPERTIWAETTSKLALLKAPAQNVEIALRPAGKLEGIVRGIQGEIFGRGVYLSLRRDNTIDRSSGGVQRDGTFSVRRLTPGLYSLSAITNGGRTTETIEIEIRAGEITGGVELVLPAR